MVKYVANYKIDPTSEGYVRATLLKKGTTTYSYVFNYTDHLGNIRLSYGLDPATNLVKIMDENHYYPFGLKHTNYNSEQLIHLRTLMSRIYHKIVDIDCADLQSLPQRLVTVSVLRVSI